MSKTAYHLQLKGFVVTDLDRKAVDNILEKHQGKHVNVLIDSAVVNLAIGISITSAFKNHGNVAVYFVGLNASADTTTDLFDGFDTIPENEIVSGAIDAAEGNYMKIDDKITSANAVDITKEILFSLDPRFRKEELHMFCSQDLVDKYNEGYLISYSGIMYNTQYDKTSVMVPTAQLQRQSTLERPMKFQLRYMLVPSRRRTVLSTATLQ